MSNDDADNNTNQSKHYVDSCSTTLQQQSTTSKNNQQSKHYVDSNRKARLKDFMNEMYEKLTIWDLIDPRKKWLLCDNDGSFLGYFNWVPPYVRVGPWSIVAICYFTVVVCGMICTGSYIAWSWRNSNNEFIIHFHSFDALQTQYPKYGSVMWYYNFVTFLWMVYILFIITKDAPWVYVTYTIQSWLMLTIRHLLVVCIPFSLTALRYAEMLRLPCFASPTITFIIWNFILTPVIYRYGMKSISEKQNFLKFCTSFRMMNIHFLNQIFCIMNVIFSTPPRILYWLYDFYIMMSLMISYMIFYLMILDRFGIHLYPIFSPRLSSFIVFITYTMNLLIHISLFFLLSYMHS